MKKLRTLIVGLLVFALMWNSSFFVTAQSKSTLGTYTITLDSGVPGQTYNIYPVIKENGGYVRPLGEWASAGWDLSENTIPSNNALGEGIKGISIYNNGEEIFPFADIDVGNAEETAKILDQNVMTDDSLKVDPPDIGYVLLRPDLAKEMYQELRHGTTQNNQPVLHNPDTVTTDENGQARFGKGQNKYFLITTGQAGTEEEAFVCIFRLVYGDGHQGDSGNTPGDVVIDVKPKKETPEIHKTIGENPDEPVNGAGYDVGSRVPFALKGTAPDLEKADSYHYVMNDTLSSGLEFDSESVKVFIDGSLLDKEFYSISSEQEDTRTVVRFQFGGENGLKDVPITSNNPSIVVTYEAILKESAFRTDKESNEVFLEYDNGGGIKTTPGEKVNIYDFGIGIDKVAIEENGDKLSGARFALVKGSEGTGYQAYCRTPTGVEWKSVVLADGQNLREALKQMQDITIGTTDDKGYTSFSGIADGEYLLIEIEAPTGYAILADPVKVTVKAVYEEDGELNQEESTVKLTEQRYEATTKVVNRKGGALPDTGGIGTRIFYVVGGILVVGASVLLVVKRRMNRED